MQHYVTKQAMSSFVRAECLKQLRLSLTHEKKCAAHRSAQGMPDEQQPRPGIQLLREAGDEWEAEKLGDLAVSFGHPAVLGKSKPLGGGRVKFGNADLIDLITEAAPGTFMAQAEFPVTPTFESALGIADYRVRYEMGFADVRPDIIQVLGQGQLGRLAVTSRGDVVTIPDNDERMQLRVIEIKLTAQPSANYFAEVTYYEILLAAWLEENGLADRFLVVPDGAVWPGSHDASVLVTRIRDAEHENLTLSLAEKLSALDEDLEPLPFDVFAPRVRRFFTHDLPSALDGDWRDLDWHVDHRCKGCDYLGYPWKRRDAQGDLIDTALPEHCMPTALTSDHLSRVAFVTRGSRGALNEGAVATVADLAGRQPNDEVFNGHQSLRATRTVVSARAASLADQDAFVAADTGTSAIMPRWADLRIYLTVDFDVGSGITFALGLRAFWLEPSVFGQNTPRAQQNWPAQAFLVQEKSLDKERDALLSLLTRIETIVNDAQQRAPSSTIQVYLWDSVQQDHLARIIGRHLGHILSQNPTLSRLAWLFPSEEMVPNATLATRMSPITVIRDVARAVLAAPVAHYYSLLQIARYYHDAGISDAQAQRRFHVHDLFEDHLSDQIPSERAHEVWTNRNSGSRTWSQTVSIMDETVKKRLDALQSVTRRLGEDLKAHLGKTAPLASTVGPVPAEGKLANDSQIWYAFAKLNAALSLLEVQQIWAMPPHEREARFRSAVLARRLDGTERTDALAALNVAGRPDVWVYELGKNSREVRAREGDFNFVLSPAGHPAFLDMALISAVRAARWTPPVEEYKLMRTRLADCSGATVVGLDRDRGLIAVQVTPHFLTNISAADLDHHGIADFSADVMLDPKSLDVFTKKLLDTLQQIGNPDPALRNPLATGIHGAPRRNSRRAPTTPVAEFLWGAPQLHQTRITRDMAPLQATLTAMNYALNPSQWHAWEDALTRRLSVLWGPPGTGKSRTACAIVFSALDLARREERPLRVLVTAATYKALDNVLDGAHAMLSAQCIPVEVKRLRGKHRSGDDVPRSLDLEIDWSRPSPEHQALHSRLLLQQGPTLIGTTPHQVHNLLKTGRSDPLAPLFDLILIDEASQMDVGQATLALAALAPDGAVVVAGDPMQLPPIHAAEPPLGLESMVGSIYAFFARQHGVPHVALNVNYRSNQEIVAFAHRAGYEPSLASAHPGLRLRLLEPFPMEQPDDWPAHLPWTPEWANLLDPTHPATCFVYPEGRSGQWNRFEADAVASMVHLLFLSRMADELEGSGKESIQAYDEERFWKQAIGIVTPHRAQQGLLISRLQQTFPLTNASLIRDAVDTVERFQGQERDVILATFALGDPDVIATEEEFLLGLNRFNVMASRPRAKLVVLVTQEVVNHLCAEIDALRDSRLLKIYADSFCARSRTMELPTSDGSVRTGQFRYR